MQFFSISPIKLGVRLNGERFAIDVTTTGGTCGEPDIPRRLHFSLRSLAEESVRECPADVERGWREYPWPPEPGEGCAPVVVTHPNLLARD